MFKKAEILVDGFPPFCYDSRLFVMHETGLQVRSRVKRPEGWNGKTVLTFSRSSFYYAVNYAVKSDLPRTENHTCRTFHPFAVKLYEVISP